MYVTKNRWASMSKYAGGKPFPLVCYRNSMSVCICTCVFICINILKKCLEGFLISSENEFSPALDLVASQKVDNGMCMHVHAFQRQS